VSLDIETIELEMFAIGAAVVHLTKQGDEYSVTVSQKRRWSIPRDFPQETASDFPFWTQFRSVYDELQSEAIPPEEMARKFNKFLVEVGEAFPHVRYSSDFGAFDVGGISTFMKRHGYEPLQFVRVRGGKTKFRTDINTGSYTRGALAALTANVNVEAPAILSANRWEALFEMFRPWGARNQFGDNPFRHTHYPDDDAAEDGWKYMTLRKLMLGRTTRTSDPTRILK